jgi:hypothetical protein
MPIAKKKLWEELETQLPPNASACREAHDKRTIAYCSFPDLFPRKISNDGD